MKNCKKSLKKVIQENFLWNNVYFYIFDGPWETNFLRKIFYAKRVVKTSSTKCCSSTGILKKENPQHIFYKRSSDKKRSSRRYSKVTSFSIKRSIFICLLLENMSKVFFRKKSFNRYSIKGGSSKWFLLERRYLKYLLQEEVFLMIFHRKEERGLS